jgi:hypothetical protein
MRVVNRTAITLAGQQPYLDWMHGRDQQFPPLERADQASRSAPALVVASARAYGAAILLPEFDNEADVLEWVEENHEWLFQMQLSAWTEDEDAWPQERDLTMFKAWFEVNIHTVVIDAADDEIEGEEV